MVITRDIGRKYDYVLLDIFAIIGRDLYGEADQIRFGNLGRASFTLFQLMTLDDWFYIYSNVSSGVTRYFKY